MKLETSKTAGVGRFLSREIQTCLCGENEIQWELWVYETHEDREHIDTHCDKCTHVWTITTLEELLKKLPSKLTVIGGNSNGFYTENGNRIFFCSDYAIYNTAKLMVETT